MEKQGLLYEGSTKRIFGTENPDILIMSFQDTITADNGARKESVAGKGAACNRISARIFKYLENRGIPTDFIEETGETETAVRKAEVIPLHVIVRNYSAGRFQEAVKINEGTQLKTPVVELNLKSRQLGNPLINGYYVLALELATEEEIDRIVKSALKINTFLKDYFSRIGMDIIDFKLEFGRSKGDIILIDEISPDTCRLWDKQTHEKLDRDRFRRNLGNVADAYREVLKRTGE